MALIEGRLGELTERRRVLDDAVSSKRTEMKMLEEGLLKEGEELKALQGSLKETTENTRELGKLIASDSGLLEEKEAKLKEASKKMAKMYEQQQKLGTEVEAVSRQKGKAQFDFNKVASDLAEAKSARQLSETRLGDLKAEWAEYEGTEPMKMNKGELEDRMRQIEGELNSLGAVNMLAPEQYEQKSGELREKKGMITRLDEEKKAILNMIKEIEGRKAEIFLETFRAVDENFRKIFNYAFPGEGLLVLDNPDDIFDSGLQIKFSVAGKDHYLDAKSGGERSLLALLFVFAIHSTKPSSFYVLDEADAALDKENSKKMVDMLKELSKKAQFIVITHNDAVLAAADVALGVSRQEGVSKVVGIEFKKIRAS